MKKEMARQRIMYRLTQNYPPGKHYFYDAHGDFIDDSRDGEYRSGTTYKRDFVSTAEFTAFNEIDSIILGNAKTYNIVSNVTFNREGPVYLRWETSGYTVVKSDLEHNVDDGCHYFKVTAPGKYNISLTKSN
jgi:hypothetical protein